MIPSSVRLKYSYNLIIHLPRSHKVITSTLSSAFSITNPVSLPSHVRSPARPAIKLGAHLPKPHSILTGYFPVRRSPDRLLPDIRPRVRRINHDAGPDKDPHMHNLVDAVPFFAPKQHVPRLGLRARDVLPHGGMVLELRRAGDGPVSGLTRRVLGEAGAVEADEAAAVVGRGAFAPAAAPDIGDPFRDPRLGGVD